MSVSNRNSGIHAGVTQAHKKCAMKMKERKNNGCVKIFFDDMKNFVWLLLKLDITNVDELQDNNSSHTKGTVCLYSKRVNGHQGDGFSSVGARTDAIKLAMAGT